MYLGKLVELGPAESLYREPLHPYTVALLASIPSPDPTVPYEPVAQTIQGEPPSPIDPPSGCRFRTRCPRAQDICAAQEPPLRELLHGHRAACHFPVTVDTPAPAVTGGAPAEGVPPPEGVPPTSGQPVATPTHPAADGGRQP
jgi:oligopeptide/dipeptide ABC transporter ATP-binding protein